MAQHKLEIKTFRATDHKVKLLKFHPTKPWLAFADKGSGYGVLDWESQQTVYEGLAGQGDDQQANSLALQRLAEKDPDFYGTRSTEIGSAKTSAAGVIREILFIDQDSCFWQIHEFMQLGSSTGDHKIMQLLGKATELRSHCWLVTVCESRIRLQDLNSSAVHDIPKPLFDGKTLTCASVLYLNSSKLVAGDKGDAAQGKDVLHPILAVGTSSGVIYLLSIKTNYCYTKLVGGHKTGVSKLVTVPGKNEMNTGEGLVSAGSDGTLALWYPSAQAENLALLAGQELTATATSKVHEGDILSLAIATASDSSSSNLRSTLIVTSGDDKRVARTLLPDLRTVDKSKPLAKGNIDGLATVTMAGPSKPTCLAITGDRAAVWVLNPGERLDGSNIAINLDNYLPLGTKKAAKCYAIARPSLRSSLVAVGSNTGVAIMEFPKDEEGCSVASIPERSGDANSGLAIPEASPGVEYVYAAPQGIYKHSYRIQRTISTEETSLKPVATSRLKLGQNNMGGPTEISVSPDGRHAAVVWLQTKQYVVYTHSHAQEWHQTQQGTGSSFVWSSTGSQCAILHHPEVRLPEPRRAKTKKSKQKDEENAQQAAAEAARLAVAEGSYIVIYDVSGSGIPTVRKRLDSRADNPLRLFGGPLLSVIINRTKGSKRGESMKFLSWSTGAPVGGELPAANWLSWEPELTAVAAGYDNAVVLYRTQPQFTAIASLSIQESTCCKWHKNLMFVASEWEVHCAFVEAAGVTPFVQSVKLASADGGISSQTVAHSSTASLSFSEGISRVGIVCIHGIQDGLLWLIDRQGEAFVIPLTHPVLRTKIAATQGDPSAAAQIAEQGLPKSQHDEVAQFIAATNHGPGMDAALSLSGLSLQAELDLSIRASKFRRALRCLQALAAGIQSPSAFLELPTWLRHQSETTPLETIRAQGATLPPISFQQLMQHTRGRSMDAKETAPEIPSHRLSLLKFIAADNVDEESSEDEELEVQTETLVGLQTAPAEAIDWDAPLTVKAKDLDEDSQDGNSAEGVEDHDIPKSKSLTSVNDSLAANGQSKANPEAEASLEEQERIAGLISPGLKLVDAAMGYGHEDVAVATLRTLFRGAGALRPEDLQSILTRCAACGLREDIRGFASRIVLDGTGAAPEPSALAAALSDNPSLSHSVLQSSGLVALSAIYSHTWKTGNSLMEINDWGRYLTAASGNGVQFVVAPPNF